MIHPCQVPPSVAGGIQQLLLSNNSLRTLGDIADFQLLRSVSLGNNLLRYMKDLGPLSKLPHLAVLILEGNPVTPMPNYRAQLVHTLHRLESLDKQRVAPFERKTAEPIVRKEAALQTTLFGER